MRNRIYLDNASTTSLAPEALESMLPFLQESWGNPSSIHGTGREARKAIDRARRQVAAAIGVTVANHDVRTTVGKITADGKITTTAENTGNFNTMGTASAMSQAKKSNAIAAGVAVSVNHNNAIVSVADDLVAGGELKVKDTVVTPSGEEKINQDRHF